MSADLFSAAVEAFRRGDLDLALKWAEQAAAAHPTAQCDHLLGLIHCRQGRPTLGVHRLRSAAEAEPANGTFKVMLARALIDSGEPGAVLRMAKPPSSTEPAQLELWRARAEAAAATANPAEAADAWSAITACGEASAEAWLNLGRSLLALDRFADAQTAYERALTIQPNDVRALFELGLLYERSNQLDKLGQMLDDARRAGAGEERLGFLWAVREHRAGNLQQAREHLMSDHVADPVRWHRLHSKIADKQGDAPTAFAASVAMNRATPDFDVWRKRAADFRNGLRRQAAAMTSQWASGLTRQQSTDRRSPVFLVGFPRSGTTLLDTFLMGHPGVVVLEEFEILRRAASIVGPLTELPSAATLESARQCYLREVADRANADFDRIVIDKQPLNMLAAPVIQALFPGTPVIFVQRHPCDAVLSAFMQSFVPNLGMASFLDLQDAADLYDAAMSLWSRAKELLPLNVHVVTYEKLVRDPEAELRSVLAFLGLGWDDRVRDHRSTANTRGTIPNTSYDQVTQELNDTAVGRWRRYEEQLRPVLPTLLPWARRLSYES